MMRGRRLVFVMLAAGCGRTGFEVSPDGATPTPAPTVTATPTATPTPLPQPYGDGKDGPLVAPSGTDTVVTECLPVPAAAAGSKTLNLSSTAQLTNGGLLLVMQVQDAFATVGDANDMTAPGDAGLWELVRVTTVVDLDTVQLDAPLSRDYASGGDLTAQACTVREYTDVTVGNGARLVARAWDGSRHGVVAFFASGTLTLSGSGFISASESGFRGGRAGGSSQATDLTAETALLGPAGGKGEGLDGRSYSIAGRGCQANGGGGGNGFNAGGGGGANGGRGGLGGTQASSRNANANTNGRGGARVVAGIERLTFGGGGGAGQQDDGFAATGGAGGGLVFVRAATLMGDGEVLANGADGGDSGNGGQEADGAGGGGAGGTIWIVAGTSSFSGAMRANGGNGGSTDSNQFVYAPGGGGGGGRVRLEGVGVTPSVALGNNGRHSSNDEWDSEPGFDGSSIP